jgi:flavin-dependent dehydrogenase
VTSTDVDVVVVGGGPVGLAASIEARMAGLSVALIEPREGAIDKACGEGLMPGAVPLLARLGVDPPGMPLRGVSYRSGSRRADHLFRTGTGRGVRRTTLHAALAARAAALHVQRITGRVDSLEQDADGVTIHGLRAAHVLAADGLHSTVRRLVGLERSAPRARRRFGITRHFEVEPWGDLIEIHWASKAEVYITPLEPRLVGVSILGAPRTDFDQTIASIPALADRIAGLASVTGLKGAGPFRRRAARPSAGRVLLVGDSSGYVDAITGEGLRLGFDQARLAVEHILGGEQYDAAWKRCTRDFRVLTSRLVLAATSPLRGGIVPLAQRMPGFYGSVVEKLAR